MSGYEWKRTETMGRQLVAKPGAGPLWPRFYDVVTLKPIFGDRDKNIRDNVNELSLERRNGYSWFNTAPAKAIEVFEKWSFKK
jgi:PelA/Pel-15E family pectate lyase